MPTAIQTIRIQNNALIGDITNWILPTNLRRFEIGNNDFTGNLSSWVLPASLDSYFSLANNSLSGDISSWRPQSTNVAFLQNQVDTLNAELNRANTTIDKYKQRFVLWQYNAYRHGIRIDSLEDALEMLEQPLIELKRRTGGK